MKIRNWEKFQHYKSGRHAEKRPDWIKLYRQLLDSYEFHSLAGGDAKFLVLLWLLAAENGGLVPPVEKIAFRFHMTNQQVRDCIDRLHDDWLEGVYTESCLEEEENKKKKKNKNKNTPPQKRRGLSYCPDNWRPSALEIAWASDKGFTHDQMLDAAEQMFDWSKGNGKKRSDWSSVWKNWLRRNGTGGKLAKPARDRMEIINELADQVDLDGSGKSTDDCKPIASELPGYSEPSAPDASRLIEAVNLDPDRD
jgi:hypothetical protein